MEQFLVAATLAVGGLMRIWEEPETPNVNTCDYLCSVAHTTEY